MRRGGGSMAVTGFICVSPLLPLQACFAYSFITIPSLSNVLSKLQLYLISGRVAIANGALSQGV